MDKKKPEQLRCRVLRKRRVGKGRGSLSSSFPVAPAYTVDRMARCGRMLSTSAERESGICHECAAGIGDGHACDLDGRPVGPDEFVLTDCSLLICWHCGHRELVLVWPERCPKCEAWTR